jgi:hypothetical protein
MKKIILTAALAISTLGLFAQGSDQLISKKGEMYLPEAGDWAISFNAVPFLNYIGNFLTSSAAGNTAPVANFLNGNQTIMGKYFVDNQTAYRAIVRIGINHTGMDNLVTDETYTGTGVPPTVTDHWSYAQHFIGLGAGMEKRRGKTRLQGYYGAELMFFLTGSSNAYTYGNAYNSTYGMGGQSTTNWTTSPPTVTTGLSRVTENDMGSTFGVNLLGFIGFEYFFMPKVSVGAEYTWGLTFSSTGQGTLTTESYTTSDMSVTTHTGGSSSFSFDNGINSAFGTGGGSLYINFHF